MENLKSQLIPDSALSAAPVLDSNRSTYLSKLCIWNLSCQYALEGMPHQRQKYVRKKYFDTHAGLLNFFLAHSLCIKKIGFEVDIDAKSVSIFEKHPLVAELKLKVS